MPALSKTRSRNELLRELQTARHANVVRAARRSESRRLGRSAQSVSPEKSVLRSLSSRHTENGTRRRRRSHHSASRRSRALLGREEQLASVMSSLSLAKDCARGRRIRTLIVATFIVLPTAFWLFCCWPFPGVRDSELIDRRKERRGLGAWRRK